MKPIYPSLVLLLIAAFTATRSASQESLVDLLSDDSCAMACYMGIEPDVTSRQELEDFLGNSNTRYTVNQLGRSERAALYDFNQASVSSYVADDSESVSMLVGLTTVVQITILLNDIPVSDILEWYGPPTKIGMGLMLFYPTEGLAFFVSANNSEFVNAVIIRGRRSILSLMNQVPNLQPCTEPANLCAIPIATPTHIPESAPIP